jgi:hypothetical protein
MDIEVAEKEVVEQQQQKQQQQENQIRLTEVVITNENVALNLMVAFLNLAQSRGAFRFDEAAKILECISTFKKS